MEGNAMCDALPERPDLDQLRRRAKELHDATRHRCGRPSTPLPARLRHQLFNNTPGLSLIAANED
jgi:hypothetical protein